MLTKCIYSYKIIKNNQKKAGEVVCGLTPKEFAVSDCQHPWSWMVVSNGGRVKPCCWTGNSVGNISEGADAVWNGQTMQELRASILAGKVHPICSGTPCPYVKGAASIHESTDIRDSKDISTSPVKSTRKAYSFDDVWYAENNADVSRAIADNTYLGTLHEHFNIFGHADGRTARYKEFDYDEDLIQCFDEAWYEEKYADVREAIQAGEISSALEHYHDHGIFEMRQFRLAPQANPSHNYKTSLVEYFTGKIQVTARPTIVTFDVTTTCNIKCVMCPHGRGQIKSPTHLDENLYDLVSHWIVPGTRVQMSGIGEPLMSPFFWKVINELENSPDVHIRVNSNGLLWNEENINAILDSNLKEVSFSIDSATPETYKKIRGASLERVLRNIKSTIEARQERGKKTPLVILNMTLMMENIKEITGFVELAHQLGVDKARIWHLDSFGDEEDWIVERKGWVFNYRDQMLHNDPQLSNSHIIAAKLRANQLGLNLTFINDREIFF